ncbi:hypothetical protein HA466_0274260 [Hirschfeldia incana]|nr:hypothetical protein HA466_0274260 [Hirschfeldia incana]KAJ0234394.1 hypothetical protein HA466_0274260 [Hirschfeldia incana]
MDLGEVMTDGEKSKEGKKRSKAPLAKLLSQYSQNPYRIMRDHVFTVGHNDVIYLSKNNLFPAPCVKSSSLMSIGCNSGDIGLEEDDEIHEKILTSITTNHQGGLDHRFSNGHLKARREESFYILHQQTLISP